MNLNKYLLGIAVSFALLAAAPQASQAASTDNYGIYKFTVSWKGDYKFFDGYAGDQFRLGNCMKVRGSYKGYIVNAPGIGNYQIIFFDRKTKQFTHLTDVPWDCVERFLCGKNQNQEDLTLSSAKTLNITTGNLDIDRSEIRCLTGRVKTVNLGTPANRIDHLVPRLLRGTFLRRSCYNSDNTTNTCYVPLTQGRRDFFYNLQAPSSGAFSCISGKGVYRFDIGLTKIWNDNDLELSFVGASIVKASLVEKGYTSAGSITDADFCNLVNLTGIEPFMP